MASVDDEIVLSGNRLKAQFILAQGKRSGTLGFVCAILQSVLKGQLNNILVCQEIAFIKHDTIFFQKCDILIMKGHCLMMFFLILYICLCLV